ncbi:MAG: DNA topoisomerase, partial [Alphaproteobacteria bacterium]|nr:DNA topoisomerase [Alphaproteobacteria bacterium]
YESTSIAIDVPIEGEKSIEFKITGNIPKEQGWRAVYTDVMEKKEEDAGELPPVENGDSSLLNPVKTDIKKTKPPARYNEGSLIDAMQNAWKFVEDKELQGRLKEAKGIGTPATRASIINGLKAQNLLMKQGKHIVPTPAGLNLYKTLKSTAPELVDPGVTALWEMKLDDILTGRQTAKQVWDEIGNAASRLIEVIQKNAPKVTKIDTGIKPPKGAKGFGNNKPTEKMIATAKSIAENRGLSLPKGCLSSFETCKDFLDEQIGGKKADPTVNIQKRLASGIFDGITAKNATSIVEVFGADSIQIIETTPDRLAEVTGFTATKIKKISQSVKDRKTCAEIGNYLRDCKIPAEYAARLVSIYGDKTKAIISETPYQLIRDYKSFGFENADRLALKLGYQKDAEARLQAAIYHRLNMASTAISESSLVAAIVKKLEVSEEAIKQALAEELKDKNITQEKDKLVIKSVTQTEKKITKRLQAISSHPLAWPPIDTEKAVQWLEQSKGFKIGEGEKGIIHQILSNKLTSLDKIRDTEFTNIVKSSLAILQAKKLETTICAPTSQEAKHYRNQLDEEVSSVTKLLQWNAKTSKFKVNAKSPLTGKFIILLAPRSLDRATILALLEAIDDQSALLIIDDFHTPLQRDSSKTFCQFIREKMPCISLPDLHLGADPSSLRLNNLFKIRRNEALSQDEQGSDYFEIEATSEEDALNKLAEIATKRLPTKFKFDPVKDIQVVSAISSATLGLRNLNKCFQAHNATSNNPMRVTVFGKQFQIGDKVIANSDYLEKDLKALQIGQIKSIDQLCEKIEIQFGSKTISFWLHELDCIDLAFAIAPSSMQQPATKAVILCLKEDQFSDQILYKAAANCSEIFVLLRVKSNTQIV